MVKYGTKELNIPLDVNGSDHTVILFLLNCLSAVHESRQKTIKVCYAVAFNPIKVHDAIVGTRCVFVQKKDMALLYTNVIEMIDLKTPKCSLVHTPQQ
jgi:hypothetical protein